MVPEISMLGEDIRFTEEEETKSPSLPPSSSAEDMSIKGRDHSSDSEEDTPTSSQSNSAQSGTVASRRPSHESEEKPDAYDLQRLALEEQLSRELAKLASQQLDHPFIKVHLEKSLVQNLVRA